MLEGHLCTRFKGDFLKGLHLFVRPIESTDQPFLERFLRQQQSDPGASPDAPAASPTPACGLLGKLLGDIVTVAGIDLTPDAVRIELLLVARELRRKRIGRVMVSELEQFAVSLDRRRLLVATSTEADPFFRRVGFRQEGDGWVKDL